MGKISPLDPFPFFWKLSPQISVCVFMQPKIHFIHYIQFTSFIYYITMALGNALHLHYTSVGYYSLPTLGLTQVQI
jgi:hypothetical protein